jgi:hypothetical protein
MDRILPRRARRTVVGQQIGNGTKNRRGICVDIVKEKRTTTNKAIITNSYEFMLVETAQRKNNAFIWR